ncbi:MAG TPA: hypothetical protein VFM06_01050 [Candidatus Limnocylindria bacterium]|nr:hypothetical protein [Candidatus Limnocylindria bacterium]
MFTLRAFGRHVGAASLAGIVAGAFVAGVLGRIAMRVSGSLSAPELVGSATAAGNRVGEITFGGTMALAVFVGIPAGILGAVLFATAEPWLRRFRPWQGVAFGLVLLLAGGSIFIEASNFDFQRFGPPSLNVAMFAALYVVFGALIARLFDRFRRAIPGTGRLGALEVVGWLAALAVGALSVLFFTSVGGLGDPLLLIAFAAVAIVPAVVWWRGLPPVIAYATFALPILVGAQRTLTGIGQILN